MDDEVRREREEERPVAPKPPPPVPVTVIETAGPTALVEWDTDGAPQRGYVPAKEVRQGTCSERTLKAAAPFGVPWAKYAKAISLSPEDIETALRRKGFWTLDDMALNRAGLSKLLFNWFGLTEMMRNVSKRR